MISDEPEARPVTLEEMLDCKECRADRQRRLLARRRIPVVSLTVVMPGPVKDTASARFLFDTALSVLTALCGERGWPIAEKTETHAATGPEAVLAVAAPLEELKRALVGIEDSHPLGRLWDFDVIDLSGTPLSRSRFGLAGRKCLLCGEPASACGRSRRHALDELLAVIENRVHAFRCS